MEYTDENRGAIQNRDRARQIIDFGGLRIGNITPTDIDGVIEYRDKAIIFLEYKYGDTELPKGQELALIRLVDNCEAAGKISAAVICSHDISDCGKDINAATATVKKIYYQKSWFEGNNGTALDAIKMIVNIAERRLPLKRV